MLRFAADLHIHTEHSPCASPDMTAALIVAEAVRKGIEVIAVCDHNTVAGVRAVLEAAVAAGPYVVPGIEITTAEEVHVLGYFGGLADACSAARAVVAGVAEPHALGASRLTLGQTVDLIHRFGGLAVAAHVDRPHFSVSSQLGFLPPDIPFDGLEISAAGVSAGRARDFAATGITLVSSSDSHAPDGMGTGITALEMEGPSFSELRLALGGQKGRRCLIA